MWTEATKALIVSKSGDGAGGATIANALKGMLNVAASSYMADEDKVVMLPTTGCRPRPMTL